MVIGVGIDLIEIDRFAASLERRPRLAKAGEQVELLDEKTVELNPEIDDARFRFPE